MKGHRRQQQAQQQRLPAPEENKWCPGLLQATPSREAQMKLGAVVRFCGSGRVGEGFWLRLGHGVWRVVCGLLEADMARDATSV